MCLFCITQLQCILWFTDPNKSGFRPIFALVQIRIPYNHLSGPHQYKWISMSWIWSCLHVCILAKPGLIASRIRISINSKKIDHNSDPFQVRTNSKLVILPLLTLKLNYHSSHLFKPFLILLPVNKCLEEIKITCFRQSRAGIYIISPYIIRNHVLIYFCEK